MSSLRLPGTAASAGVGSAFSPAGSASGLPIFAVSSFSMLESLQTGHESRPRDFWLSKSSDDANHHSKRWRSGQISSKTITFAFPGKHSTAPERDPAVSRGDPSGINPRGAQRSQRDPEDDDRRARDAAHGPAARGDVPRPRPALLENRMRNHPHGEGDAERDQDKIVQIPQDRNEIRDEIDGAQRISRDCGHQELRVPRRAWMTRGEIECNGLGLEIARALAES